MVTIKNLNFSYKEKDLFSNLNLDLKQGKIYGLLGKNGAGKTTLLKIICGLIFSKSGQCMVFDYESKKRIPDMLKEIFFIPETYFLPDTSIENYEKLMSVFYDRFDRDYFYEKIKEFELEKTNKIKNLSYGQKKKVLLAFGLASKCRIVIFDEPTNGLDIPTQKQMRKLLADCILDDRAIIISTHHVREMENIFDSIVLLDNGKIIFNEELNTISEKLSVKIVQSLDGLDNIVYSEEIPGGYSILTKNESGLGNKVDMEFLFNAIINQNEKINSLFK